MVAEPSGSVEHTLGTKNTVF